MTRSDGISLVLSVAILLGAGVGAWLIASKDTPAPAKTSTTKPSHKEDDFNVVVLSPEQDKQLHIRTGKVELKNTMRVRIYGGEVMVPAGKTVIVSAPLSGTLRAPSTGVPQPGKIVTAGTPVFQLLPLLTPEGQANLAASRVDADGQINNARAAFDAAKIALDRAKSLLKDMVGNQRMVDDAEALYIQAQKTLEAATARRDLLVKVLGDAQTGTSSPVAMTCPADGLLRNVMVRADQTVPAGAPLFEIVDLSAVWVRVPVYVGDLPDLAITEAAEIGNLSMRPGEPTRPAMPVAAPPAANPAAGTVDLFYGLDNKSNPLSPGQRVGVSVPLKGKTENLTVPWSAIVHDINGGSWVYEKSTTAEHTYIRRRVVVKWIADGEAVLAPGLKPGLTVVIAGTPELFGQETGYSK